MLIKKTRKNLELSEYPSLFYPWLAGAAVYDSSCSRGARVTFIDRDGGLFLKSAPRGSLENEAAMTRFFHQKGLGAQVLEYASLEQDWLLTRRVPGEDCLAAGYLSDPRRLCDTTAELLRALHEVSPEGCAVDQTVIRTEAARRNYTAGHYDRTLFPGNWDYDTPEEAWQVIQTQAQYLGHDTLLHGDYCLPNIILDGWKFSGFIDLDGAGAGDRHIDLFWGVWSLGFNLKTHAYRDRFLDAYGRDRVEPELLRVVAALEVFG